jgi:transaldolase
MNSLKELNTCGQSYWLDNLTRGKIASGELCKRVAEEGLSGITSNPAIFHKAITESKDYDQQIQELAKQHKDTKAIYEAIVVQDIQNACDILRKVYDETGGLDGYVSLEISPHLARDTKGTMDEVKRLFLQVNRPNCFIKIPGTEEGVPAIEEMLYEGININITLLFSQDMYEKVARGYIRAMKRRKDEGKPIGNIASVASFFLSRIDVLVDQLLSHRISAQPEVKKLFGKLAVANAKMAYQRFLKIFSGKEWEELAAAGARVQRPLWASTSTKNPDYSDVMYIEPLIGKDTVNTIPDSTVKAFLEHGKVQCGSILQDVKEAEATLSQLKKVGIDLDFVTAQLVNEGIQKFIDPFEDLLKSISIKSGTKQ